MTRIKKRSFFGKKVCHLIVSAVFTGLFGLVGVQSAAGLTIVLDFDSNPGPNDPWGRPTGGFDVTDFGFDAAAAGTVQSSVLSALVNDYLNYPTFGMDGNSPIPDGKELDIDFVIGAIGTLPSNGDSEYYYTHIGTSDPGTPYLGVAYTNSIRAGDGTRPYGDANIGRNLAWIFTDNIAGMGVSPSDALTSGNLTYTTNAIAGTLAHEIGHTLSLGHVSGANPGDSDYSIMGTGASPVYMPNNERLKDRAFSYDNMTSLITAVGLRDDTAPVPEPVTMLLFGVGLSGIGLFRARQGKRKMR